jgi:hypothetical protein
MKYLLNIFLVTIILISGISITSAQNYAPSTGKVPGIKSGKFENYKSEWVMAGELAYGYASITTKTISLPIPSGTPLDSLNSWTAPVFASSMIKGPNGKYYIVEHTPSLYEFDPSDGSVTLIGNIIGMVGSDIPNGISYNPNDGQYYICSGENLYLFNVTSRTATLIGNTGVAGALFIDLCFDASGICYAYDLITDAAYTLEPTTGFATKLGSLGYDANFGQGMSYDFSTGTIYLSAFNNTTFTGQLRTMNPLDGSTTLIVDWGFEQIAPFAIDVLFAPDAPVLQYPGNGSNAIPTNVALVWYSSNGATEYGIQISLNSSFSPSFDFNGISDTTLNIPIVLPSNTRFFWRVNATNSFGSSSYSNAWNFTTVSTINLNTTITYPNKTNPDDYNSSDYKLVGLPGNDNLTIASVVSGTQGTDWEAYWDNGNTSDYFVKYNSSSPFRFTAGTSYWIINKGNLTINESVTAAAINASGAFAIPLEDGFNLITNPFTVPVDWSSVLTYNSLPQSTQLNSFSSGWSSSSTMQPYVGYFIDNAANVNPLLIPYPIGTSQLAKQISQDIWRVNIDLSCGEVVDRTSSFGVANNADEARDEFDFRKPRALGNIPSVYFYHPDWDADYGLFATDIRPEFNEEETWEFKVDSEIREKIKLNFSEIESLPNEFSIYLIDNDRSDYINLRNQNEYEFTPIRNSSDFQIMVGRPEILDSKLENILPKEFMLGGNFPNPFNPSTTIEVSIPEKSELKLTIYNIVGQEVKVLFEGSAEPGRQWFVWDGKDQQGLTLPSGIYLYNLITSTGVNLSNKMILIK